MTGNEEGVIKVGWVYYTGKGLFTYMISAKKSFFDCSEIHLADLNDITDLVSFACRPK